MTDDSKGSPWNSLEVTKLIVGLALPLTLLFVGNRLEQQRSQDKAASEAFQVQQANVQRRAEAILQRRLFLWDKLATPLNDIYCYFLFVGTWKELSPEIVIARKREVDRILYTNRPFFSEAFFRATRDFLSQCFKPFGGGWAKDAPLRTRPLRPSDANPGNATFTNEDNLSAIDNAFTTVLTAAADELGAKLPNADTDVVSEARKAFSSTPSKANP